MTGARKVAVLWLVAVAGLAVPLADADLAFGDDYTFGESGTWDYVRGTWELTEEGLSNVGGGERRLLQDLGLLPDEYVVEFSAKLDQGKGWGIWFGADLDDRNRVSGLGFQYDPGYGSGKYLLRNWSSNRESVTARSSLSVEYGVFHDYRLEVGADYFRAFEDNALVLSYNGALDHAGNLLGLRTWSNSEATFRSPAGRGPAVPEPTSFILIAGGIVLLTTRRR